MNPFNTKEYWNNRFASGDWEKNAGTEQTAYFAHVACSMLPEFVKRDMLENTWSVIDVGCAEGEATAFLAKQFPNCCFTGQDISEEAVQRAAKKYPDCKFSIADVYEEIIPGDVVFSSNMLEHLEDPIFVMNKMCESAKKYVILLLPFQDGSGCQEHINFFTLKSFPLQLGQFYLEYSRLVDCAQIEGDDWRWPQILLVYTNSNYRPGYMTLQDVHNQYNTTCLSMEDLCQSLEVTKQDLYRLLLEKDKTASQQERLEGQLQETLKQLSASVEQQMQAVQQLQQKEAQRAEMERQLASSEAKRVEVEGQLASSEARRMEIEGQLATSEAHRTKMGEQLASSEGQRKQMAKQLQETAAQLQTVRDESSRLEKELKERNYYYDDLYAYSAKRDQELENIKSSRSYCFFVKFVKSPLHISYCAALKIKRMIIFLFTLRWGLLGKELLSPFQKIILRIRGHLEYKKTMSMLLGEIAGRNVIIFPPTLDWNMMLFQRPQQLAIAYAQKPNTTVIYLTANLKHDHVALAEKIKPHLILAFSGCFQELLPLLNYANKTVMSLSWTINKSYVDMLKPAKLIYEYIDELEIFDKYDEQMLHDHQNLMRLADVTVCTATKLFNQAKGQAKNPILSTNAGDYSFFAKTSQYDISPLLQDKIRSYRCVLGYYGALASWFDYDLVIEIARKRPDWLFVLVGMDYDGTLGKSGVLECSNVVYIPPQPYQELPHFLKAFDIALIPFRINEITLSTSPVKLFEYMAAEKPILTSKMPECLKYESVRTYKDADEFCALAEGLLALAPGDPYWETLRREALENTWDARTDQILEAIGLPPAKG